MRKYVTRGAQGAPPPGQIGLKQQIILYCPIICYDIFISYIYLDLDYIVKAGVFILSYIILFYDIVS